MATTWVNPKLDREPAMRITIPLADNEQRSRNLRTQPSRPEIRMAIVCTDDCENCIMYKLGCAKKCTRFPDIVCEACPCRASIFAGDINKE